MKVVVFGATGGTGREVAGQALAKGHEVSAFVRNADALGELRERVRVVLGDATGDPARVEAAIQGQDVVVSALGRRKSFRSAGLIERSMAAIIPAMQRSGVRRIFTVSACGVGETRRQAPLVPRIMYRLLLEDIFADKAIGDAMLRSSGLDWTILYPTLLSDAPMGGRYRVGEYLELEGLPKIARADVAHFIVSHLAGDKYVRKGLVMSN
jgi:putative NADH-flavin reductase